MISAHKHLIFHAITRQEIEQFDLSSFLFVYDPAGRSRQELENLRGALVPFVTGYDDDPRELCEIPEVRAFFSDLNQRWPYFAFFLNTQRETESVKIFLFCALSSTAVCRREASAKFTIAVDWNEAVEIVARSAGKCGPLWDQANTSTADRHAQITSIATALKASPIIYQRL